MEQELVEYVVKSLVSNPEAVQTNVVDGPEGKIIELRVGQGEEGKIIGKNGSVAKAIRTLLQAAAIKSGSRYVLEILG